MRHLRINLSLVVILLFTARPIEAGIAVLDLTSLGTNAVDVTGTNAGLTYGDAEKTVQGFIPGFDIGLDLYNFGTLGINTYFGLDPDGLAESDYTNIFDFAVDASDPTSPHNFAFGDTIGGETNGVEWTESIYRTAFVYDHPGQTTTFNGTTYVLSEPATHFSADFGRSSYIGFRISSDTSKTENTIYHYGYIEVTFTYAGLNEGTSFEVLSAAYESTPGKSILAGATPEPSTAISMGLLGVVGFAGNRRRRRSATV